MEKFDDSASAPKLLLVLLTCTLSACSVVERRNAPPALPSYGNFLTTKTDPTALAVAAAQLLASKFPPAQTSLQLDPPPNDAFGMALVTQLRERGYAVLEPPPGGEKAVADDALVLQYVVDQQGTTPQDTTYRVLLQVGKETLARLYTERNGQFEPISNWVRGELRR